MTFQSPQAFLLLIILPVIFFYKRAGGVSRGTEYSSLPEELNHVGSLREKLSPLPYILNMISLVLLITALARPVEGYETVKEMTKGIAINMVLDRSSSMGTPVTPDGNRDRLDAVKEAFIQFVQGDGKELPGRDADLIGLITFGRFGETLAPLTLSHKTLVDFTGTIKLIDNRDEDGTSIGDAVALAAARLRETEMENRRSDYEIRSKIIILLTDGQNNGGEISPLDAADLSARLGIKLYTIGFGAGFYRNAFGIVKRIPEGYGVDEKTLKEMAEKTGGKYYSADSEEALKKIYSEIDSLEKSNIESYTYKNYTERFMSFTLGALAVLLLSYILSVTWLRRIP